MCQAARLWCSALLVHHTALSQAHSITQHALGLPLLIGREQALRRTASSLPPLFFPFVIIPIHTYNNVLTLLLCRLIVMANVPSSPILVTLTTEALHSFEKSVLTRATWRNSTEDGILSFWASMLPQFIIM
jgi:hypothetical protein